MKRAWLIFLILIFSVSFSHPQSLKLEKEIDLSFFLNPYQPFLAYAAVDSQGNIFIAQRGKDSFIKLDPAGQVILRAPQKIEGEITKFDIDNEGNAVCVFRGRTTGNYFYLPLVWFDGITGKKIREINLGEIFGLVTQIKILRPKDLILINGLARNEKPIKHSLHLIDFNGNLLRSFSPLKHQGDGPEIIDKNSDYFAVAPYFDPDNLLIFQAFPELGQVKYFDLNGNQIGEADWSSKNTFLIYSGNLWIKDKEGFRIFEKKGNTFVPTEAMVKADNNSPINGYPIAIDSSGKIYFLGGKESQMLRIYAPQY